MPFTFKDILTGLIFKAMDRRELLLGLFSLSGKLHTQSLVTDDGTRLEDASLPAVKRLLRNDLTSAGLPVPATFDLFPDSAFSRGQYDDTIDSVTGEGKKLLILKEAYKLFRTGFRGEPGCGKQVLLGEAKSWRIFVAVHETAHYCAGKLLNGDISLFDRVYSGAAGIPPQNAKQYVSAKLEEANFSIDDTRPDPYVFIVKIMNDRRFDSALVAFFDYQQIHEKIADAAATLYLLSNYKDVRDNPAFINDLIDLRTGLFSDPLHSDADVMRTAAALFRKKPVTGMSITDATKLAATIVGNMPRQNLTTEQKAQKIRDNINTAYNIWAGKKVDTDLRNEAFAARNRLCRVANPVRLAASRAATAPPALAR